MAYYAALVSIVQSLKEIIDRDQYSKFLLDKQQIASVYQKLSHLQALLEDYSPKDEETANCLESRIRDATYQVQDILESQSITEYKSLNLAPSKEKFHRVNTILPRLFLSKLKRAMPQQLQDIEKVKKEVDAIVEEVMRMKIKKSHTTEELELTNNHSASEQKQTSYGDNMVGFEEQRTKIIDQLYGESSKLKVIPLVGMGGIGKTTLARSIFYDKIIASHFDCRAWVTVSQNYHLRKLLLDILGSMNVETKNLSGVEERLLKEHIHKHLTWRRYLIILDDIWNTNVWDDMKMILPDDNNGSRIILTTRLSDMAVYANKCGSLHQMQFLNKDQSWDLLREKVFGQENCPQELEVVGRLIANNCRGLPLAIVVVAGLLSVVNKTGNAWEDIARNLSSLATENNEHFSKILALSYNHLPHHLKPCFLYMGGFPKDYKFCISKLIKLWAAEGFLKVDEFKSLEEMGEEYLKDLVKRNLVLITKKKSNGNFKYCSIHDILRHLCLKRARFEKFLHVVDGDDDYLYTTGRRNIVRRLYIHRAPSMIMKAEDFGSHVHSILGFHDFTMLLSFALNSRPLRVFDARNVGFYSFPAQVLELSRLRYLAFGQRCEFEIPPRITELENLQTLIIGSLEFLFNARTMMPFRIWRMPHLRHIIAGNMRFSLYIPFGCTLPNLQTLRGVTNFRFIYQVIQMIPNLLKLKAYYRTERSEEWGEFCLYNLVRLRKLETLAIYFDAREKKNLFFSCKDIAFPQKLKKLSISGCRIPWKDITVVGSLPHLEVLKLQKQAFVGDKWEPVEGQFLNLKFLLMRSLTLKYWRAENTHFPRLERLVIKFCFKLEEIPLEIGDIPTLELIRVDSGKLVEDSARRIQEEQQNYGNDVLQVEVRDAFGHFFK